MASSRGRYRAVQNRTRSIAKLLSKLRPLKNKNKKRRIAGPIALYTVVLDARLTDGMMWDGGQGAATFGVQILSGGTKFRDIVNAQGPIHFT